MTATPGTAMGLPNLKAKTFALALLPFALALTACGGSSSDDSGTTKTTKPDSSDSCGPGTTYNNDTKQCVVNPDPNPDPDDNVYAPYTESFKLLSDLAAAKVDLFQLFDSKSSWYMPTLGMMKNRELLKKLQDAYDHENVTDATPGLTTEQRQEFRRLLGYVRTTYVSTYEEFEALDDLSDYVYADDDILNNTQGAFARSNASLYISDTAENNRKTTQENLIAALKTKYDSASNAWGIKTLSNLEVFNYKESDEIDTTTLVGFLNPDGVPNKLSAQLSFYHAHSGNKSIGVDMVHMKDVSFFLYYYANTEKDGAVADLKGTPHLSRDDFMKQLKEKRIGGDSLAGVVNGSAPSSMRSLTDPNNLLNDDPENITYTGVMLAATTSKDGNNLVDGFNTHMGDVQVVLDFGGTTNPQKNALNVDVEFTNILETSKYLNGMKSDNKMTFKNLKIDLSHDDNATYFSESFLSTRAYSSSFNLDASSENYNPILGRFYGDTTLDSTAVKSQNYNHQAVGGIFARQLDSAFKAGKDFRPIDDNLTDAGKTAPIYYGVFGAVAE